MATTLTSHPDTSWTADEIAAVRRPLTEASLLPPRVYGSTALYDVERRRVFQRHWIPYCRLSELAPGSFLARTLFDEPVVVTRDEHGEVRAMANVCRHRNRQIVDDSPRCTQERIMTCPYHGWAYDLQGQLRGTPQMQQAKGFDRADWTLPSLQVDVWQGWVFVNFDMNAPKLSSQLKTLDKALEPYRLAEMETFEFVQYPARWNWKVTLENFTEAYHQATIHRDSAEPIMPSALTQYEEVDGPYNLFYMPYAPQIEFLPSFPTIPGLTGDACHTAVVVNVFPYFHLLIDPTAVMWLDFNVRAVDDHDCIWRMMLPPSSAALEGFEDRKEATRSLIQQVWDEDFSACAGVQRGAASMHARAGRLSHMEKSVYQFQNWMLDRYLEG